ncbi:MAG: flagellar protein FlbB [Leptospiraceae bacterium]|nr:flagellar protein FlbB [Leptospiraceae bacterium]MDW8305975.1 flagellar protein FlbB [Leptospiraceae bacterium]
MTNRRMVALLLILIAFLSLSIFYFLNLIGVIEGEKLLPFLAAQNPPIIEDNAYPTEMEKLEFQKWQERLYEKEEELLRREKEIEQKGLEAEQKLKEIAELRAGILAERKKLEMLMKDWEDRQKKIKELATKVVNMPPEKAKEMMQNWRDFDIIEVMRQIDKDAEAEGNPSITPYLLTLFPPERRAEITRKMLLPPLQQEELAEESSE